MAADKEAFGLSSIRLYYSKCNSSLQDIVSILLLNIFHTLMVLWENKYFLASNLVCSLTSVKSCLPVISKVYQFRNELSKGLCKEKKKIP